MNEEIYLKFYVSIPFYPIDGNKEKQANKVETDHRITRPTKK